MPYRGTGPAVTDLLGGTIDVMFLPIHVALQHVKAGNLKALAISSREAQRRCCPTCRRCASSSSASSTWRCGTACWRPRARPRPVVDRLNAELKNILALPDVKTAFETQGMVPASSTPEEFQAADEQGCHPLGAT